MEGQSICKRPQHCRGVGGGRGTSHSPGVTGTRGSGLPERVCESQAGKRGGEWFRPVKRGNQLEFRASPRVIRNRRNSNKCSFRLTQRETHS